MTLKCVNLVNAVNGQLVYNQLEWTKVLNETRFQYINGTPIVVGGLGLENVLSASRSRTIGLGDQAIGINQMVGTGLNVTTDWRFDQEIVTCLGLPADQKYMIVFAPGAYQFLEYFNNAKYDNRNAYSTFRTVVSRFGYRFDLTMFY